MYCLCCRRRISPSPESNGSSIDVSPSNVSSIDVSSSPESNGSSPESETSSVSIFTKFTITPPTEKTIAIYKLHSLIDFISDDQIKNNYTANQEKIFLDLCKKPI